MVVQLCQVNGTLSRHCPWAIHAVLVKMSQGQWRGGQRGRWRWLVVPRPRTGRQPAPGSGPDRATLRRGAAGPPSVLGLRQRALPCRVTTVPCRLSVCPCLSAVRHAGCARLSSPRPIFHPSLCFSPGCLSHHPPPSQGLGKEAHGGDLEVRSGDPAAAGLGVLGLWPGHLNGVSLCSC